MKAPTTNNSAGYFIYARKSTESEDRQVRSIGDQLAELHELARKHGVDVVDELVESQTAKLPGRPVFNLMLDRIEKGEARGILAWHPDRLARNSIDGGRLIYLVDSGKITDLKFPTFWFDPTPQGKFMLAIAFGQSKYYVDNLSENIRRGQRQKLKNGIWPQWAPLGYLNDRRTRGIVPDPDRGPFIRKAFEFYATGKYTLDGLTAAINAIGMTSREGNPLSRAQYCRMLGNPIYHGLIRYGGELHEGTHEPLIDKKLFDAVQSVIEQRGHAKPVSMKPYVYRKLFRCGECGGVMTIETQKGFNYLRCTKKKGPCSQPYVREDEASRQVSEIFDRLALPHEWLGYMNDGLEQRLRKSSADLGEHRESLRQKVEAVDTKIERLTTAYLEQTLSLDEYREMKNKLVAGKAGIKARLDELEQQPQNRLEPLQRFVKSLSEATLLASTEKLVEKSKFVRKLGSNRTIRDRQIRIELHEPWKTVEKHARVAHQTIAAPGFGAASCGKPEHICTSAERARFELA